MSLEDKFLLALLSQGSPASMSTIANSLSITENALLSIINRVMSLNPEYVTIQKDRVDAAMVQLNPNLQNEVKIFLADGGFTAINERELREYYTIELRKEKFESFKRKLQEQNWIKWIKGIGVTIAGSLSIAAMVYAVKEKNTDYLKRKMKSSYSKKALKFK